MGKAGRGRVALVDVRSFLNELYGADLHAKRIASLADATLGVMHAASLAVAAIGQALALARGLVTKHAIKQVDRLLSNQGIDVWDSFARWVPQQIGKRQDILVAMDWTDFDHDDRATLALHLVTGHGRAAPLLWLTVWKDELKDRRNDFEDACLRRLAELVPAGCRVTILADRGFGDQKLFAYLAELGFGYVIRFRGNIHVTDASGTTKPAAEWVGSGGRARKLADARVTARGQQVGAVVCVHAKDMKEPWCLATSERNATAATPINHYAKRWTIDIDQAWRLSRIKRWVVSTCNEALWVEHRGSVLSPGQIRTADRQAIADRRGRAIPALRRGVRRALCRQDWQADCRATPDIRRGSSRAC
jgi:hypothetical protein